MTTSKFTFWGQEIVLAVGKSAEEFKVANVKLTIPDLNEGIVYTLADESGSGFKRFVIVINEDHIAYSTVAHEVWHLFWNIVDLVSPKGAPFTAEELSKEAYAFLFGELYRNVYTRI